VTRAASLALLALVCWTGCVPDVGRSELGGRDLYQLLLDAEDSRPVGSEALALLLDATELDDPFLRRTAVRALGRLERPSLASSLTRHLADTDVEVRAAAAEAVAQSVHGEDGAEVLDPLLARVGTEADPAVRAMLARSLGRLQLGAADRRRVVEALIELAGPEGDAPEETLVGVALGFESLTRLQEDASLSLPAAELLMALMGHGVEETPGSAPSDAGHIRALAAAALGQARRLSGELIGSGLEDPEPEVRRTVLGYLSAAAPTLRDRLVARGLADSSVHVATAAVRYLAGVSRTEARCDRLVDVAGPASVPAVRLPALEALARPCPVPRPQRAVLVATVGELQDSTAPWQPAARALLSLANIDPDAASDRLDPFVEHENPFVRAWAARTAASLRDVESLFTLAVDPSPNVRVEAARGLYAVEGHGLDDFLVEQLDTNDPQLLLTVAGLLDGAPQRTRVARAALEAFERISRAQRETWRDPRMALLERIAQLGDVTLADRLTPFLADYDPVVADRVAEVLGEWTGRPHTAEPQPLPHAPLPTLAELRALEGSRLTLHMSGGGALVIELLPDQATTNVTRFARLAESGYYDGLTFHRWVPNFVIQGGSPGANEYQGDGPYTRDEVGGMPHWRGTVGLSTRGRDTGDGQIFVNLVDNMRLDYEYTVMGRLVAGYDTLDGILEGGTIERAVVTQER
jgi:peptidyl-prolyl cis-trans isomerase B (cyclophilin B)